MSAGGLEVPIAKAAAAAVSRVALPVWRRAAQARNLRQAADLMDRSEAAVPELTPAQGASVAHYVGSRDFHVVAVQVALSTLAAWIGQPVPIPDGAITQQLTEGLSDRTVVLGDPGGGKSTLAAKTVHDLANDPAGLVPLRCAPFTE